MSGERMSTELRGLYLIAFMSLILIGVRVTMAGYDRAVACGFAMAAVIVVLVSLVSNGVFVPKNRMPSA